MDLPEITEAKRLTLNPGDSLIVRLDRYPSQEEAYEIRTRLRAALGKDVPVIVLDPSADIEVSGAGDLDLFVRTLQEYIRKRGGSVQTVLGS